MESWKGRAETAVMLRTLTAMSLNGLVMYLAAAVIERRGSAVMQRAGSLLFVVVVLGP